MKKALGLALVLGLGVMLMTGCQTTSSQPATTTVPCTTAASSVGMMAMQTMTIDDMIYSAAGISSALSTKAQTASAPAYSGGWWTSTDSGAVSGYYSYDYTYNFKVWDTTPTEITDATTLGNLAQAQVGQIYIYATIALTYTSTQAGTASYNVGLGSSKSAPLMLTGLNTGSAKLNGPVTYSSSYSGTTYDVAMTYSNLGMAGGYPTAGSVVTFSVASGGSTIFAGTVTYSGGNTAVIAFTTGATGTYTVNLDTGTVS